MFGFLIKDKDTVAGPTNVFQGEVTAVVYMGDMLECQVALGEAIMRLRLHPSSAVKAGQSVSLAISGRRLPGPGGLTPETA